MNKRRNIIILVIVIIVLVGWLMIKMVNYFTTDPREVLVEKIEEKHGKNYEMLQAYNFGGSGFSSHGCEAIMIADEKLIKATITAKPLSNNYNNYYEENINIVENEAIKDLMAEQNVIYMEDAYTLGDKQNYDLKIMFQGETYTDFLSYKEDIKRVCEDCRNKYDFSNIQIFLSHDIDFNDLYHRAYMNGYSNKYVYYDIIKSKTDVEDSILNLNIYKEDSDEDIEKTFDRMYETIQKNR